MIERKVWGTTELVTKNGALEYHRIEIEQGGYCSKHKHHTKWNGFHVERGRLLVRVWNGAHVDETVLSDGQYTEVPPGAYHQFEALDHCLAFELYWAQYNPQDIEREDVGGMR